MLGKASFRLLSCSTATHPLTLSDDLCPRAFCWKKMKRPKASMLSLAYRHSMPASCSSVSHYCRCVATSAMINWAPYCSFQSSWDLKQPETFYFLNPYHIYTLIWWIIGILFEKVMWCYFFKAFGLQNQSLEKKTYWVQGHQQKGHPWLLYAYNTHLSCNSKLQNQLEKHPDLRSSAVKLNMLKVTNKVHLCYTNGRPPGRTDSTNISSGNQKGLNCDGKKHKP